MKQNIIHIGLRKYLPNNFDKQNLLEKLHRNLRIQSSCYKKRWNVAPLTAFFAGFEQSPAKKVKNTA